MLNYTHFAQEKERNNMGRFKKREKEFVEAMNDAKSWLPFGTELEMDYYSDWDDDDNIIPERCGWYAYYYNGSEASPLESFSQDPLITDDEIEKYNVDIWRCFKAVDCYVCG